MCAHTRKAEGDLTHTEEEKASDPGQRWEGCGHKPKYLEVTRRWDRQGRLPPAAAGGCVATTTVFFGSSPINFGTPDSPPSTSCFSLHLLPNSKAREVFLKHSSHPLSPPPCQSHLCPYTKVQMCLPGLQVSAWPGLTYSVPQQESSPDHKGFSRVSGSVILCPSSCCPLVCLSCHYVPGSQHRACHIVGAQYRISKQVNKK